MSYSPTQMASDPPPSYHRKLMVIQYEILHPFFTDYYTELYQVSGCQTVTITATINPEPSGDGPIQLLCGDAESDCPLDIIVELMVLQTACVRVIENCAYMSAIQKGNMAQLMLVTLS